MSISKTTFTVGDLRDQLQEYSDDTLLSFEGELTFDHMKNCGENEVMVLFAEVQADLTHLKKKYPHVKVAFLETGDVEFDESGVLGRPVNVTLR